MTTQTVIGLLAALTLFSNIALVIFLLWFGLSKVGKPVFKDWKTVEGLISSNSVKIALLVSATATLGSLYFSEIAGFEPCKLCWLQRIFMYPLPIIFGIALWNGLKDSFKYVIPLSVIGMAIAAYHYYYQITGNPLIPCSTVGFSVSCSERFFTYYGYITIPWMSLSAFTYVFLLGILGKKVN
jgi:disulfide bond formation protein DsbB